MSLVYSGLYECKGELSIPRVGMDTLNIKTQQQLVIFAKEGTVTSDQAKEIPWALLYVIVGFVLIVLTIVVICRYA